MWQYVHVCPSWESNVKPIPQLPSGLGHALRTSPFESA
jgi:hypothetical protein